MVSGADKTVKKLRLLAESALDDAVENALDEAIDRGKDHIKEHNAIWRKEVLGRTMHAEFNWTELDEGEKYFIQNTARHAGIVDQGADFTDYPDADGLIEWVQSELADWHPFDDDSGPDGPSGGNDGGSGSAGGSVSTGSSSLDSIASGIGSITESQDTEDLGYVAGGSPEYVDNYEFNASVFQTLGNNEFGNPTPDSGHIIADTGFNDVTYVPSRDGGEYPVLPEDHEEQLIDSLYSRFNDSQVDRVLEAIEQWKKGSYNENAQYVEKLAKRNYEIDAPLRGENVFDSRNPVGYELQTFHELSIASQEFLTRHLGDENGNIQLYRGFRTEQVAELAKKVFDNPDADSYEFSDTVIENYTPSKSTAQSFSRGIEVEVIADIDSNVVLAPDYILNYQTPPGNNDAEINLIGGERHFDADSLSFDGFSIDDLFVDNPQRLTGDEHEAIRSLVTAMHHEGISVESLDAKEFLTEWLSAYQSEFGNNEKLQEIVAEITYEAGLWTWDDGKPFDDDQSMQLWYGQEVTYELSQEEKTSTITSFDHEQATFENGDSIQFDSISPMFGTQFLSGENWYEAHPSLSDQYQQLDDELAKRVEIVNTAGYRQETVDAITEKATEYLSGELRENIRDVEAYRKLIHNLGVIELSDDYQAAVQYGPNNGLYILYLSDEIVDISIDRADNYMAHEMMHAFHQTNGYISSVYDGELVSAWKDYEFEVGPHPNVPFGRWNSDGSPNKAAPDWSSLPVQHEHIKRYMFYHRNDADESDTENYTGTNHVGLDNWVEDVSPVFDDVNDNDWEPDAGSPVERFIESINYALWEAQLSSSYTPEDGDTNHWNTIDVILGYSLTSSNELAAHVQEVMNGSHQSIEDDLLWLYSRYPYIVRAYFEVFDLNDVNFERLEEVAIERGDTELLRELNEIQED